jgi:tetratricopeptide (TPR) repeat protein
MNRLSLVPLLTLALATTPGAPSSTTVSSSSKVGSSAPQANSPSSAPPQATQDNPQLQPLSPNAAASPNNPLQQAHRLIDAARFSEAESLLRAELQSDPRSPDANTALAYCLLRENKPAEALKQYTAAAALRTPTTDDLINVGQAYILLNDTTDADHWTLRAVRMSPDNAEAWYSLGRIRYTEQRFADAQSCFQRALAISPRSAKIVNNLGLAEEGLNHSDEAVAAYRQAIAWQGPGASTPGSEQPYLNLGIVLLHRGQLDEAGTLLDRALAISPHDPRIHEQLGHLHLQQGDPKAAAEAFTQAVHLDPTNSSLHFLLGQCYRRLGQTEQAQSEFSEAERLTHASTAPPKP